MSQEEARRAAREASSERLWRAFFGLFKDAPEASSVAKTGKLSLEWHVGRFAIAMVPMVATWIYLSTISPAEIGFDESVGGVSHAEKDTKVTKVEDKQREVQARDVSASMLQLQTDVNAMKGDFLRFQDHVDEALKRLEQRTRYQDAESKSQPNDSKKTMEKNGGITQTTVATPTSTLEYDSQRTWFNWCQQVVAYWTDTPSNNQGKCDVAIDFI